MLVKALGKSSGTCHGPQWRIAYALVVIRRWATHSVVWSCSPAVAEAHLHSRSLFSLVSIGSWATHSVVWSCSPAVAEAHLHSRSLSSFYLSLSRIWSVLLALACLYCVLLLLSKIESLSSLSLSSCNTAFLSVLNHGSFAHPPSRSLCLALSLSLLLHFSHFLLSNACCVFLYLSDKLFSSSQLFLTQFCCHFISLPPLLPLHICSRPIPVLQLPL